MNKELWAIVRIRGEKIAPGLANWLKPTLAAYAKSLMKQQD